MASNTFFTAQLIGRLGGDAEVRYTPNGKLVLSFNVAHDPWTPAGQDPKTTWVRCTIWGQLAETMSNLIENNNALAKGDQVFVAGEPSVSSYTSGDGTAKASQELNVREIRLLGPRKDAAQS